MSTDARKSRKKRGERSDGRIQVTYTDGYRQDGKPNRISFYGKTRAEAERKRDDYIHHRNSRISGDDITVAEWIEQYKSSYRQNVNTAYLNNDAVPYDRLAAAIGHTQGFSYANFLKTDHVLTTPVLYIRALRAIRDVHSRIFALSKATKSREASSFPVSF